MAELRCCPGCGVPVPDGLGYRGTVFCSALCQRSAPDTVAEVSVDCWAPGKVRYFTRRRADKAIRQNHAGDSSIESYLDTACGFYHIGHPSPKLAQYRANRIDREQEGHR